MTDVKEDDNSAFVVHVPPNGTDTTVESCLRLGAGPPTGAVGDETTTYNDIVSKADPLTHLTSVYNAQAGIALLTPGAINLLAAGGVNSTCGAFSNNSIASSNSTIGSSYTVNIDPSSKHVISATYTNNDLGTWGTSSYNMASLVSVNMVPLQATLNTALASFSLSGPIAFNNNYGLAWSSMIGVSFTAQLARVTNIGWRTIVSNQWDGSNNAYFTKEQQSTTSAGFAWSVPVTGLYASFDSAQNAWCTVINVGVAVMDAAAIAYSLWGLGVATGGSPDSVQSYLKAAEPVAIACTILNGIFAVAAFALSIWVDNFIADTKPPKAPNPHNAGATSLTLGDGNATMQTGADDQAPYLKLVDATVGPAPGYARVPVKQITLAVGDDTAPKLKMDGMDGMHGVVLGKTDKGLITMSDQSLLLEFGPTGSKATIKMDATGILLSMGTHSINITSSGIQIAGQSVTLEALMANFNTLQTQINSPQTGLAATNQTCTTAASSAAEAQRQASAARTAADDAATRARRSAEAAQAAASSVRPPPTPGSPPP